MYLCDQCDQHRDNDSGHDNIAHRDVTDNTDDDSWESPEDLGN